MAVSPSGPRRRAAAICGCQPAVPWMRQAGVKGSDGWPSNWERITRTGVNFEGPAPRPLERARIVLADDGQILVDKSVKFQQEKGEWDNPESFLKA